jgi:acylphosphatase
MRFVRLTIHGRVQGVGFRAFVEHEASQRGLEGWVRNRRDGSVETLIAGDGLVLDDMIEICRRGPAIARVDRMDIAEVGADELARRAPGERFSVLQTV